MTAGLKVLNWILIVLFGISAFGVLADTDGSAEMIGSVLGAVLLLLIPVLTLRALEPSASKRARRAAYIGNALPIMLFGLLGLTLLDDVDQATYLWSLLIVGVPVGLNIWGVWKLSRPAPLELTLVEDETISTRPEPTPSAEVIRSDVSPAASVSPQVRQGPSPAPLEPTSRNYFIRHWRGELSLPVSYWGNGVLLGLLVVFAYAAIAVALEGASLQFASIVSIFQLLFLVVSTVWSVAGIWRSAGHHPARGGSAGWATTARVLTGIGMLSFAGTLMNTIVPQLKEFTLIATGHDPIGELTATISTDGEALILHGAFGAGSAKEVRQLLNAAPGIETVMLDSPGGRMKEAEDVAAMVSAQRLDTYVESRCESACTYVFLAGRDRAATPNAKIGFHRPMFVGFDETGNYQLLLRAQATYRAAGISQAFLDKVAATPPEAMWYPTREELIDNGVINRISMGGEVANLTSRLFHSQAEIALAMREIPIFATYERHFPGTIAQAAEAAWLANQSGATDADMLTASRAIFASNIRHLLAAANRDQVEMFADLMLDQLRAAKAVSAEACGLLLSSELDITKVLPAELAQRELDWTLSVLQGPLTPRPPVDAAKLEVVLDGVVAAMSPTDLAVFIDMAAYAEQPARQCDATIGFYQAVTSLPEPERSVALRGLFEPE